MSAEKRDWMQHVEGLRGLAIGLVVLFHMDGAVWGNAYLGVDVFLVITGYLLFRRRLAQPGRTDWRGALRYLARRVQRIVPPMLVVILLALVAGLGLLWWNDELLQCKLAYAALLARANDMLSREFSNYFANSAAYMPLLHLWYLSVTLQIYALYIVAEQVLQRLPKWLATTALLVVGVASLLFCYGASVAEWLGWPGEAPPQVSYYWTLPRLWEVLAGGLVCVLPGCRSRAIAGLATVAGLCCILVPALSGTLPGLGFAASLPGALPVVLGTVLVLRYMPQSRVLPLLSNRLLTWLGSISFSLYLVHMPIIVYMRMWVIGEPGMWYEVFMLACSLAAGALFFRGVERRRCPWWLVVSLWAATLVICRAGRKSEGFRSLVPLSNWEVPTYTDWKMCLSPALTRDTPTTDFPFSDGVFTMMNQLDSKPKNIVSPLLVMGAEHPAPRCVLIGDSHAQHLYAGLDAVFKQENIPGIYLSSYIYPLRGWEEDKKPVPGVVTPREQALLAWLARHPEISHVIIAQRWCIRLSSSPAHFENDLRLFLSALKHAGKKAIVVGPAPEFPSQAALLHYDKIFLLRKLQGDCSKVATCDAARYMAVNGPVLALLHKMQDEGLCTLLEPLQALAPGEAFLSLKDGRLMMKDNNHMFCSMAIELVQKLLPALRAALLQEKNT